MIRLVALACGLLCGAGFVISGLHDPALLQGFLIPQGAWAFSLGLGVLCAVTVACLVLSVAGNRGAPLLGGHLEPAPGGSGWKPMMSALAFGLGWGLAGYIPLTAMVSIGVFSPGAAIFLISVLGGMLLSDGFTGGFRRSDGRRGSFG